MQSLIVYIFAFLLFNFVIMAHEWGHYITAKKFGVKVNEFAIGMGPKIIKFERGETTYSLRLFPVGGFCALEGEEDSEKYNKNKNQKSDTKRSLRSKPAWQKAIIMIAGVFMNFLVGVILSIFLTASKENIYSTKINSIVTSSGEYIESENLLKPDDEIIAIDGYKIHVLRDVSFAATVSNDNQFQVDVIRDGKFKSLKDVSLVSTDAEGNKSLAVTFKTIDKNFINIINYAVTDVGSLIRNSWGTIIGLIKRKISIKDLSGPVGIATQISGIASQEKNLGPALLRITTFMMMISISLGVFNILPFPALDGGRVVLLIPEVITGKPVNQKVEEIINTAGIILLIGLMIFITYNDVKDIIMSIF